MRVLSLILAGALVWTPARINEPKPLPLVRTDVHVDVDQYVRSYVKHRASRNGWIGKEWVCLRSLIHAESRWSMTAKNPTSSARGLFQILKTPAGLSLEKMTNRGFEYVSRRYDTPCKAWSYWKQHRYY